MGQLALIGGLSILATARALNPTPLPGQFVIAPDPTPRIECFQSANAVACCCFLIKQAPPNTALGCHAGNC